MSFGKPRINDSPQQDRRSRPNQRVIQYGTHRAWLGFASLRHDAEAGLLHVHLYGHDPANVRVTVGDEPATTQSEDPATETTIAYEYRVPCAIALRWNLMNRSVQDRLADEASSQPDFPIELRRGASGLISVETDHLVIRYPASRRDTA